MAVKVLHLIPTLLGGGAERQLTNLVCGSSREIIHHVVCVIGEAEFFSGKLRDAGFKVIQLDIFAKRPFFQAARKFREVIGQEKPDIIHSWLYDANVSARLAILLNGKVPLVTSLQLADYEPETARIGNYAPYKVKGLKAIDKVTALLTKPYFAPCSEFVKNSYNRNYGLDEARTRVIYNAVDPDSLFATDGEAEAVRTELALPEDAFIYLNVGRLDPQKNHTLILRAFAKALEKVPEAYLLLAGVGALEESLKKQAVDLGIAHRTMFLGRRKDVGALLEMADVFVFPSFFEGLPVALIEAMFKSLPCIASRVEVFEEVIDDGVNGLLVGPESVEELEAAMIGLYQDGALREKLGENAAREARSKYTIAATAGQWEAFYHKIKGSS